MLHQSSLFFCCTFFVSLLFTAPTTSIFAEEKANPNVIDKKIDLHTYCLLSRVAYQIGKEKYFLPNECKLDSLNTVNGLIKTSIDRLTIAESNVAESSKIQKVSFRTIFTWPEFPIANSDLSIPTVTVLICEESKTGHMWSEFIKDELIVPKGSPAMEELSLEHSESMNSGEYTITAIVFAELSPERPLSLLAIRQEHFTVTESGVTNSKQTIKDDQNLKTCQLLAFVAHQIGSEKYLIPKDKLPNTRLNIYDQVKYSIKVLPPPGTKVKIPEALSMSCVVESDWIDFPLIQADLSIPVILAVSCESSEKGHLWTDFFRPIAHVSWNQPVPSEFSLSKELNGVRGGKRVPAGEYTMTSMLFVNIPPKNLPTLIGIKQTKFTIEPAVVNKAK
ncbi:hypothetical protein Pan153_17380 [Gimesia panareensis]|uniref:Ig-like domain-containing protein n=1 Tax=Gimesia panareensis TaxID=2527978 RepID=A0A518FL84_9PLAN|nr:hypothetical protein [Gimesia panareensis]QDV17103.1 hypothetical protein Pan153_17380 [Gimesia panareensis]